MVVDAGVTVWESFTVFGPLHPLEAGEAEAVQPVALLEDQVRVLEPPGATLVGLALRFRVGVGVGVPPLFTVTVIEAEPAFPTSS